MLVANQRTWICESANRSLRIGGAATISHIDMRPLPVKRHAEARVIDALDDTPVVILQGARHVGKSTLAGEVAGLRGGRVVTLDDDAVRAAAAVDPAGFIDAAPGLLVIDEVQRVPALLLAIKAAVDRDRRPGQFLLAGSANLLRLRSVRDSLAGRAETIELFGFSQGELRGEREQFIDRAMTTVLDVGWKSPMTRREYLDAACTGGYPEVVFRRLHRRAAWYDSYTSRIVDRDAADVSSLQRLGDLGRLVRLLAARNASELNVADVSADGGFPARTLPPYLDLLETLYLTWRVPAWSTNLTQRVTARPKIVVLDSGLAAHQMNLSPESMHPTRQPEPAGGLLEAFVLGELRKQIGWSDNRVRIFHYRDRTGPEVDILLEHPDGRIVGIEVKASSNIGLRTFRWLSKLRDGLGPRFVQGIVLHTGTDALAFGDRLTAQPIAALWT